MVSGTSLIESCWNPGQFGNVGAALKVGKREGKTVLVVEDCDDDLFLFQLAAREAECGLSFHYVTNGEKAIAYLKGEEPYADREAHPLPDLVVLDLCLPAEDGFGVLEWIRNGDGFKKLEVIVVSGSVDPAHVERAMRGGANKFIPKPIEAEALREVAKAVLTCND